MIYRPGNLIVKGARAELFESMARVPQTWDKYCQKVSSNTKVEPYAWPGALPKPRVHIDGRALQTMRDFTQNITNVAYEMSFVIDRDYIADDQTGLIMSNIRSIGEAYGSYKNELFATMIEAGGSSTATFDGVAYFSDSRTIGDSGTIDNNTTSAAGTGTIPTSAEFLADLKTIVAAMHRFNDDKARPYNEVALQNISCLIPPEYEGPVREALNASFISQTDNTMKGYASFDVFPYLTDDDLMFVCALGAEKKPFVYQQREALEVVMHDSAESYAHNNGLLVECRERFVFAYGDPRRCVLHTYS